MRYRESNVDMQNKQLEVVVMVGLPASGKSTIAGLNYPSHQIISLDKMEHPIREKEQELIEQSLAKGNSVVICDTNITREIRARHIETAKKYNAYLVAVFLNLPIEVILKRNYNREIKVPDLAIFKMRDELERPGYDEGFDKIQIISSSDDTMGRVPMKHVIYTDGGSKKEGNYIAWLDDTTKEEFSDRSIGKDNFRCECLAIIHALQNNGTLQYGDEIEIRCDSKALVEQIKGNFNLNEEDIRWYVLLIRNITKNYTRVAFEWVPSEENKAGKILGK